MKKLIIALGAFFALLVAIVVIPMVVDVDKYRPQIVAAANEKLNGQFDLGHLQLSLWGQIHVQVDGITLKDKQGNSILSVKDAYFHLPFLPLLTGSPVIELKMDTPTVNVVKNHAGKLNVMSLMKGAEIVPGQPIASAKSPAGKTTAASPTAPAQPTTTAQAPTAAQPVAAPQAVAIPAIVTRARIGFDLLHALVSYKDETTGLVTEMKDLNFVVKSLSLSHPSEISIWSDFDTRMGKSLDVKGPGRIDLTFSPQVSGSTLQQFTLKGKADFDSLEIAVPGTFEKKKGVPANIELAVSGSDQEVKIDSADINFFNAKITSNGTITNVQTAPTVHYSLKSNEIDLSSWVELLPMLKEYELGGKANLSAELGGLASKISYQAKIGVNGLTAKAGKLKSQPRFDAQIDIATDQIQSMLITMKAPGNELQIRGKMLSFTAPQITVDVSSSGMDLDQLIDFQTPSKTASVILPLIQSAFAEANPKQADYDALLDSLRTNKMAASTTANIGLNLKMLKAQNIKMTDMTGKLYFKDLAAGLDNFNMKIFSGTIKANMSSQLKPKMPTYKFSTQVAGLDLGEASKAMPSFRDTATGKANFDMSGEGMSFNPDPAKQNLKAKGSMKITNAEFTSIDVGKMVTEALNGSISKVAGKVPGMGGKKINSLPNESSKYDLISADFGIQNGNFSAPNFVAKATANKGIDLKGATAVGLKEQSIKADWEVIDTYNLTHAKDIGANVAGTDIPHILAEGNKPVTFPIGVGCTLKAPCYSYAQVAEYFIKIALGNLSGGAKTAAKSQLQNQIQKMAPQLGGALKSLFH